jgi:hypothetical protein
LQAFLDRISAVQRVLGPKHPASVAHRTPEELEGKPESFPKQIHPVCFLQILVRKEVC